MGSRLSIPEEASDEQLIRQVRQGDEEAYYILFERYWEELYRIAFLILKNRELAQDVVQEIFLDLWEKRGVREIEQVRHYLLRAAKFASLKVIRNNKGTEIDLLEPWMSPATEPENIHDQQVRQETLEKAISDLPDKCQEVFRLSRFEELSNQEIAEKLDLSKRTVETHISNALKHLRKTLPKDRFIQLFLTLFI